MRKFILLVVVSLMGGIAMAQNSGFTVSGLTFLEVLEVGLSSAEGMSGDIKIPDVVENNGKFYRVTSIKRDAFRNCSSVTSLELGNQVRVIEPYAIAGTFSSINIPVSVREVDPLSFYACPNLRYISAENSNYLWDDKGVLYNKLTKKLLVFPVKSDMSDYVVPEGIEYICSYAFWESSVRSLDIPSSVWFFGGADNNVSLETLVVRAMVPPTFKASSMSNTVLKNAVLYVPDESLEDYRSHNEWGSFANIKPLGEYTGVVTLRNTKSKNSAVYDLRGIPAQGKVGLNLILDKDGSVRKVIKK